MLATASNYIAEERRVLVLVDGDQEGQNRQKQLKDWADRKKKDLPVIILSTYNKAPCSIENLLEPNRYGQAVLGAAQQLIADGTIKDPDAANWTEDLTKRLGTEDQKSLGKRAEEATKQILGQGISDTLIAIKYDQLLRDAKPEVAKAYWATPALQQLAEDLWKALDLPRRGDTTNIPLAG